MSEVNWEMEVDRRNRDLKRLENALILIGDIVRTPTKATAYKSAQDHFQGDFDAIRKIVSAALRVPTVPLQKCGDQP